MKFNERFNLDMPQGQARVRFTNRILQILFPLFPDGSYAFATTGTINRVLGERGLTPTQIATVVENDFPRLLDMLERLHKYKASHDDPDKLSEHITRELADADEDLGVVWRAEDGEFRLSGARILDDRLVNDPLDWLRTRGLSTVHEPFDKSLRHLFESRKDKSLLEDAVTNAYNALEAMAKVVVDPNALFPANRERFIDKLGISKEYKRIAKEMTDYAHKFRHGEGIPKPKPTPTEAEVESFIYSVGMLIRLAVQSL